MSERIMFCRTNPDNWSALDCSDREKPTAYTVFSGGTEYLGVVSKRSIPLYRYFDNGRRREVTRGFSRSWIAYGVDGVRLWRDFDTRLDAARALLPREQQQR